MSRVALQLYTLRDESARDLESVLRRVADLGYEGVELFDLHGHRADRVRAWLDGLGLVVVGRHAGLDDLESDLPALAAELGTLGSDRVALSWIEPPKTREQAEASVARIAGVAERARELGLRFGYHNHWGELLELDGATMLDLLRELPAELLWLELDLGWIWAAGADPVEQLERTRGRCPLVHVKDLRDGRVHCAVGDGAVGYERVLPAAVSAGVEWLIVEQDEVDGHPFESVARSLAAVRDMVGAAA